MRERERVGDIFNISCVFRHEEMKTENICFFTSLMSERDTQKMSDGDRI